MRTLALWLLTSACVSTGYVTAARLVSHAGAHASLGVNTFGVSQVLSGAVVCLIGLGGAGLLVAVVRPAGRRLVFPAVLLSLALARGLAVGAQPAPAVRAAVRGVSPKVRIVEVVAASKPGPSCRLEIRTDAGQLLAAFAPPEACPRARGDRLWVLGHELGTRDPSGSIRLSAVWAAPGTSPVGLSQLAASMRTSAWQVSRGRSDLGFVVAATLGLPSALPPAERHDLRRSGLGHLIAVSGLHVGLAALVLMAGLRWAFARLPRGPHLAYLISAIPVVCYVLLTGAAPPAVRAALMLGIMGLGAVTGRPTHGFTVLAAGCAAMLLVAPEWAVAPGFQLSVAAMVVLLGLPQGSGAALTSWQLSWALLPLVWLHFDAASDGSVLANTIGVPVFTLMVVPAAVLGWLGFPWLGPAALEPAAAGAQVILDVSRVVVAWPELPRSVWVGLALLTWAPMVRTRVRPAVRRWLPHRGAAALLLAVAAIRACASPAPLEGWTAWGNAGVPEVLSVDASGQACIRDPAASTSRWARRLEEHRARTLVRIDFRRGSFSEPHRAALSQARSGLAPVQHEQRGLPSCTAPDRAHVDAALASCAAFATPPIARVSTSSGGLQCWSAQSQRWRPAA